MHRNLSCGQWVGFCVNFILLKTERETSDDPVKLQSLLSGNVCKFHVARKAKMSNPLSSIQTLFLFLKSWPLLCVQVEKELFFILNSI